MSSPTPALRLAEQMDGVSPKKRSRRRRDKENTPNHRTPTPPVHGKQISPAAKDLGQGKSSRKQAPSLALAKKPYFVKKSKGRKEDMLLSGAYNGLFLTNPLTQPGNKTDAVSAVGGLPSAQSDAQSGSDTKYQDLLLDDVNPSDAEEGSENVESKRSSKLIIEVEELTKKIALLAAEKSALEREKIALEKQKSSLEKEKMDLEKDKVSLHKELQIQSAASQQLTRENEKLLKINSKLNATCQALNQQLLEASQKLDAHILSFSQKDSEIQEERVKVQSLTEKNATIEEELKNLHKTLEEHNSQQQEEKRVNQEDFLKSCFWRIGLAVKFELAAQGHINLPLLSEVYDEAISISPEQWPVWVKEQLTTLQQ